jgi:hypothetical protein
MHWMIRVEVAELNVHLGYLIESFSRIGMNSAKEKLTGHHFQKG